VTEQSAPTVASMEAWWGVIQASVNAPSPPGAGRGSASARLWDMIHAEATRRGITWAGNPVAEVNRLRSLAVGNREARRRIGAARPGDILTSQMLGRAIYARPAAVSERQPLYHARFDVTRVIDGEVVAGSFTVRYESHNLPSTVGELRDDLAAISSSLADTYGASGPELTGISIEAL